MPGESRVREVVRSAIVIASLLSIGACGDDGWADHAKGGTSTFMCP